MYVKLHRLVERITSIASRPYNTTACRPSAARRTVMSTSATACCTVIAILASPLPSCHCVAATIYPDCILLCSEILCPCLTSFICSTCSHSILHNPKAHVEVVA
uniref:Uncharacterized protein n=1 Tax=Hyaloperonospora arabidopsidis (strain Emoy2) TaxID=559515 RepID=M4BKE1_HYAAE